MAVTLTDITAATWATLSRPPDGLAVPTHPSAECLRDTNACKAGTVRIDDKSRYVRNTDWDPRPLPSISRPISWPFLKAPILDKLPGTGETILNLAFVPAPPAGYKVKIYKAAYSSGVNLPPQVIAVAYPMDLDVSKPPAFIVHYKHIPGQAAPGSPGSELFKFFDPEGYDWVAFEIWNWLVYNAWIGPTLSYIVDMPFLSVTQRSFGLTYQLRQSAKPYVIVLPQISRVFEGGKLRDYQLYSAETLRNVLLQIQTDLFKGTLKIDEDILSHVAISTNSSGCNVVTEFLVSNLAHMKNKDIADFMSNEFKELFVFDPPEKLAGAIVAPAVKWKNLASTRTTSSAKSVRFYTHIFIKELSALSGGAAPFKPGESGYWESADKSISLTYLPFSQTKNDIWQRTLRKWIPASRLAVSNFDFVHHAIPALCLTDAAAKSVHI